jgi:hypothetical protein
VSAHNDPAQNLAKRYGGCLEMGVWAKEAQGMSLFSLLSVYIFEIVDSNKRL